MRTSLREQLLPCCEEKVVDFHKFVIRLRQDREFVLSQIGNADQTPVNSDLSMNRTVEQRGEGSVLIKTTGAEKQRFTVMLPVTAGGGSKLPPTVIFTSKTLLKVNFLAGIHVRAQEKGRMSANLTTDRVCRVWERQPGALLLLSLLMLDSFRGHPGKNVHRKLNEPRIEIDTIRDVTFA